LPTSTHAVVLAVDSEDELRRLESRAQHRNLPHCAIREPDAPYNGALMAIGFLPGPKQHFKNLLGRYPLLKEHKGGSL